MGPVFNGQFSKEAWKTVRLAMSNWGRTLRLILILAVLGSPVVALAVISRLQIG